MTSASEITIFFFILVVFQSDGYVKPDTEVEFYLYTQSNPKKPDLIKINNTKSLNDSHFDESNDVRIVIHGFDSNYQGKMQTILDGYIKSSCNLNIILVNWKKAKKMQCKSIIYHYICLIRSTSGNLPSIGASINEFVDFLMREKRKITLNKIHLIGHSLGAHISGYAGNIMLKGKYGAIYALDPAGPGFRLLPLEFKLNKESAEYVVVFHSSNLFGISEPLGDVDFYFNYGKKQPQCSSIIFGSVCNHRAAVEYFSLSLYGATFFGSRCEYKDILLEKCAECSTTWNNCTRIDSIIYQHNNGIYLINTISKSPFGIALKVTNCEYNKKP